MNFPVSCFSSGSSLTPLQGACIVGVMLLVVIGAATYAWRQFLRRETKLEEVQEKIRTMRRELDTWTTATLPGDRPCTILDTVHGSGSRPARGEGDFLLNEREAFSALLSNAQALGADAIIDIATELSEIGLEKPARRGLFQTITVGHAAIRYTGLAVRYD